MADPRDGGDNWNDPLDDIDFEEFDLEENGSYEDQGSDETGYATTPPALVTCPSCGAAQPATNRHCEQCGARLSQGPLPVAPRPLANVTAGTRALTVILAVLGVVVILALAFQFFGGDDGAPAANGSETTTPDGEPADGPTETTIAGEVGPTTQLLPITITCSSSLNDGTLACDNLIDDDNSTDWNDASLQGVGAVFNVTFAETVQLQQVHFSNLSDDLRFRRNFRIRTIEIITDDLPGLPIPAEIENTNDRPHVVNAPTLGTTSVTIRVLSVHPSEAVDGRAFDELALSDITFWGKVVDTSGTTEPDNTNSDG